ncbi:pF03382 family protein [Firmicutes bacterium CAG:822]|nr:pF03382 family protein [Firmicutes bacterium CAG:822]
MRRYRRKRKNNKIIIIGSLSLLLCLCVGYAAFSTNLTITAKGNIKEPSRVIMEFPWATSKYFYSDYYKKTIISATFLDTNNVPSNATESWDVSEDNKGGVKAWVVPNNDDSTKYDLYIGANGGVIANEISWMLFFNMLALESINFNDNFDTSNVIDMSWMFAGSNSLTSLDLSGFDTSNVQSMRGMFTRWDPIANAFGSSSLQNIIFGDNFTTKNVTNMVDMFSGFRGTSLDLSNLDTSNVVDMYHMFNGCTNLEELNLCSFNTFKVTDMRGMFMNTLNIKNIYTGINWIITGSDTTDLFANSGVSSVTTGQC